MIKRNIVLVGLVISLLFMLIAISIYPGGSIFDNNSIGFNLSKNFISNLFEAKALNGAENVSRIWAIMAMLFLPISYAIFFNHMANKLPEKNAKLILKYGGLVNILVMFLIVTPLHDVMLYTSISLFWTGIVVITVFVFKTKLHFFKFFCLICLIIFYYSLYLWGVSDWALLPIIQKLNFFSSTLLILGLEYFTKKADFDQIQLKIKSK